MGLVKMACQQALDQREGARTRCAFQPQKMKDGRNANNLSQNPTATDVRKKKASIKKQEQRGETTKWRSAYRPGQAKVVLFEGLALVTMDYFKNRTTFNKLEHDTWSRF